MDKSMIINVYISFTLFRYCCSFILPITDIKDCPGVKCSNNGTISLETCTCDCLPGYSGYFCETETRQTNWPDGHYALHSAMFGCPESADYGWTTGYANMTLNANSRNMFWSDDDRFSFEPYILGPYTQQKLQINFCIMKCNRTQLINGSQEVKHWPVGNYCIYKAGDNCPKYFQEGSMTMRGYTFDFGGELPNITGNNESELTLSYCCREDGNTSVPIALPDFPFILFMGPSTDKCQEVTNMEWIYNAFYVTNENKDFEFNGLFPNFSTPAKYERHIGIRLCYYLPTSRRECMYKTDGGASYNGRTNVTKSGRPCLPWTEVKDYTTHTQWVGEFEENYCRTVSYSAKSPLCFYDKDSNEDCDIPHCAEDSDELEVFGKGLSYNAAPWLDDSPPEHAVDGLIGVIGFTSQSARPYAKPWYLLNLDEFIEVHAIVLHRQRVWFPINHRYVGSYVSKYRWDFIAYGAYRCDYNRNPRLNKIFRYQCKRPIIGQYVSVKDFDFTTPGHRHGYYNYLEIDEIQVIGKRTTCGRRLGLITGEVYDYQLESSSNKDPVHLATYGRLFFPETGWCARNDDKNPWFLVDLIIPHEIQGIELQGIKDGQLDQLIKTFELMFGHERKILKPYEDPIGTVKIFRIGSTISTSSVHRYIFNRNVYTRYIKIVPVDFTYPCLKLEIIGCPKRGIRDIWCRDYKYDFGYEVLRYHTFWMDESSDPTKLTTNLNIEQCMEYCQNISCLSYTFTQITTSCYLHHGHKYTPHYRKWWIDGVEPSTLSYQRLCFKEFEEVDHCGGNIFLNDDNATTIYSPSFPLSYEQGLNCVWSIQSDMYVEIEILAMSLQMSTSLNDLQKMGIYDIYPGACKDTLSIVDGSGLSRKITHTPIASTLRGTKIISASRTIEIHLSTCFQYKRENSRAFELKIRRKDLPGCGTIDSCYQTCEQPTAYIMTPGFPSYYQSDATCFWKIKGAYGQFVKFSFINLDIVDNSDALCEKSYISVFDVDLQDNINSLGKFCKAKRPYEPLVSSWHNMHIEFRASSDSKRGFGFLGRYSIESFSQESFHNDSLKEDCPPQWHKFAHSCYIVHNKQYGITWIDAENECQSFGGHLVSIGGRSEMEFLHYLITVVLNGLDGDEAYIGLQKKTDGYHIADFVWSDGSPITFTAWYHNAVDGKAQPDGLQNEKCSIIRLFSIHNMNDWHDVACAYDKISNLICEIDRTTKTREDIRDSILLKTIDNEDNLFRCSSGEFILDTFLCDGITDCSSGEDEHNNCSSSCSEEHFTCDNGDCISISLYCDFIGHCVDESDEQYCERKPCSADEWRCTNGQCIHSTQRCDFQPHCFDASDELNCEICGSNSFQCYDQSCIPNTRVCDGFVDCSGLFHEDESAECLQQTQYSCAEWWAKGMRENGEYHIDLGFNESAKVECIFEKSLNSVRTTTLVHHQDEEMVRAALEAFDISPKYYASDKHIANLKDMSTCSQSLEVHCYFTENIIYRVDVNGIQTDNQNPETNCSCPFVGNCEKDKNRCNCGTRDTDWYTADDNEIRSDIGVISDESQLPIKQVTTVRTESDNKFVTTKLGPLICIQDVDISVDVFRCAGGQTLNSDIVCLLDYDEREELTGCRDLSHLSNCVDFKCPPGYMKCQDSYCVPPKLLCNGVQDCPLGEDEYNCSKPMCHGLHRCHNSNICIIPSKRCNGVLECPESDDELLCNTICPPECQCHGLTMKCIYDGNGNLTFPTNMRKLDLSSSNLQTSYIILEDNFNLAELNLSSSEIVDLRHVTFGQYTNLYSFDLSFNKLAVIPRYAFKMMFHLKTLLLHGNTLLRTVFPESFVGLISLPVLLFERTQLNTLTENTFTGLDNLRTLNLTGSGIQNIEDRAFLGLRNLKSLDITRNSITQFSKDIFEGLEHLENIYSDSFVFCCLRPSSVKEENCLPGRDEFSSCADMMRNDILRTCLWVIGLCALVGNFIVIGYRVLYDRTSLSKGHGIFITSLGTADFLMGIYMLTIASADAMFRGKYVWNDLSWRYGVPCKIAGVLSTVSSECSVLFLFLITIDRFIAIKYPFGDVRFGKNSALFFSCSVFFVSTVVAILPLISGWYFDGNFYSRSAVCLALPLTRDKPVGWEYSFGIFIVFNFILFLVIAGIQLVIYREVKNTLGQVRSTQKRQDLTIARNLFVIVFSDFLCWFPVGVMGLMALSGKSIPGEVYAWTAVFILPINSALNPFLYTFSAVIRTRRNTLKKRASEHSVLTSKISVISQNSSTVKANDLFDICSKDGNLFEKFNMFVKNAMNEELLDTSDIDKMVKTLTTVKETLRKDNMHKNDSCKSLDGMAAPDEKKQPLSMM